MYICTIRIPNLLNPPQKNAKMINNCGWFFLNRGFWGWFLIYRNFEKRMQEFDVCWYTLMSWILTQAHLLGTKTWTGKQAPHHFPRKQKNQPFMIFMPLTAVSGHQISVTKNPTSSQLGMFCLTTLFYLSEAPTGCSEHQKKTWRMNTNHRVLAFDEAIALF